MPRPRSPNRDRAFELFKEHGGKIKLVDIAKMLGIKDGQVRKWKSTDKWEEKIKGTLPNDKGTFLNNKKNINNRQKTQKAVEVESVSKNETITDKQKLFCLFYIRNFNATKAYKKAYECSYETALRCGPRMLGNVGVKKEIEMLKKERLNREFFSEEDIFRKYMDIAFSDITDYIEFGQEEMPIVTKDGFIEEIDKETGKKRKITQTVNVVRLKESIELDGSLISEVMQGKSGTIIKLVDKMRALAWLSDHMDLATTKQKAEIKKLEIDIKQIMDDDLEDTQDDGFLEALKNNMKEDWKGD